MKEEKEEPIAEAKEEEEPKIEAVEEPEAEAREAPKIEAVEEPAAEQEEVPKIEAVGEPQPDDIDDRLELDRMEVKPEEEPKEESVEPAVAEPAVVEPEEPEEEQPARPGLLALLAGYWIWILAALVGLSVVSAVLLFLMAPEGTVRKETKLGKRVHVITASLGGEHYVRFNLYGPFRHPKGQEALRRGMPKIKHDLIVSGADPRVVVSIEERDLYFLEGHILEIVGDATGIAVEELDLKGLSITRYSDETEVGGEG